MNLPATCAKCHSNTNLTKEYQIEFPEAANQYMDSIHGTALLKMGLIVAPSCNDCHGAHKIKRSVDRDSPINHANVAKTCGKCHVGIEETYNKSVHGQLLAKGDPRGPVCIDCHSAHQIVNPTGKNFKSLSDERCGKCHADRLEHYRETYHGKAMMLGKANAAPEVAACYDCHGFHDILPVSNPASHLSTNNILVTCQKCHPGATAKFTEYRPHANPLDKKNYPLLHVVFLAMTGLLIGTFSFFGLHTLAWLVRAVWLYLHDSKTFREAKIKTQEGDEWFTRFQPFERFLHFLVVTSFLTAGRHRHAAEILLHRLGEIYFQHHRRTGNGADAAPLRRHHHVPVFHAALEFARRPVLEGPGQPAQSGNRQNRNQALLLRAVRPRLDGADDGRT
jgi:nitrate/TMAO reductase-like tetraheme cytochrome c subunit